MPVKLVDAVCHPNPMTFSQTFTITITVKAGNHDPALKARARYILQSIIGLQFNRPAGQVTEFDGDPFDVPAAGKETELDELGISVVSPGVVPLRFQVLVEVTELDGGGNPIGSPDTLPVRIRVSP